MTLVAKVESEMFITLEVIRKYLFEMCTHMTFGRAYVCSR